AEDTRRACAGAANVYNCTNAPDYRRWPEEFPPLQRGVPAGGAAAPGCYRLYRPGERMRAALTAVPATSTPIQITSARTPVGNTPAKPTAGRSAGTRGFGSVPVVEAGDLLRDPRG